MSAHRSISASKGSQRLEIRSSSIAPTSSSACCWACSFTCSLGFWCSSCLVLFFGYGRQRATDQYPSETGLSGCARTLYWPPFDAPLVPDSPLCVRPDCTESRSYSFPETTNTTPRPCFSIRTGSARAVSIIKPKPFRHAWSIPVKSPTSFETKQLLSTTGNCVNFGVVERRETDGKAKRRTARSRRAFVFQ